MAEQSDHFYDHACAWVICARIGARMSGDVLAV